MLDLEGFRGSNEGTEYVFLHFRIFAQCKQIKFINRAVESVYKEKILNVTCSLVLKIFEFEIEEVYNSVKTDILHVLGQSLKEWLNKGKIKIDKESAKKLKALTFTAKSECLSPDLVDYFAKKLHDLAPKWKGQVQNEALNVLHSISNLTNFQ